LTTLELVTFARDLHAVHGLMPVPVHGKIPLGGTGWNQLPLAQRLMIASSSDCTGIGIQCGFIWHPRWGPLEARGLDCDIDDPAKSMLFANHLQTYYDPVQQRWGRRPGWMVFTEPGIIKNEKFGPVQLLGDGKQMVWCGAYQNKSPLPTDPLEYTRFGPSLLTSSPPLVRAEILRQAIESSLAVAGISLPQKSMLIDAVPLNEADIALLTADSLAEFEAQIKSMLIDVAFSPTGSGRGTKLYHLGVKYGALIKASGQAPLLVDAMRQVGVAVVEYQTIENPILSQIGCMADQVFAGLPGTLGAGDKRDFARGVGASLGLGQSVAVFKAKHALEAPTGRGYLGQTGDALMREDLPPLKFLVDNFFPDNGCVVIAGKPKVGKGWIVLDLAMAVTEGSTFWSQKCHQGEVLLYMLEDGRRRIKQRMQMLRPNGYMSGKNIRFRYSIDGPFSVNSDGTGTLLDDIRVHVRQRSVRMVVVDVFQRVRGVLERNLDAYQQDYKIMGAIQKLANELNVLIVVVHHTKKGKVDDVIDSISGSFGISGAVDGMMIIGKEGDMMRVQSKMRDIRDFEFDLVKEGDNPMWKPAQTAVELTAPNDSTKTQNVALALHAAACSLTAGDITVRTGINEKNVATYLGRLLKSGQIIRTSRGFYMAKGLPSRERLKGVIDLLKRSSAKMPVTREIEQQYAPNGAPPDATFMMLTPVAINEIEAGFINGRDALQSLKQRGVLTFNSDTLWLIGPDWDTPQYQTYHPNPFAQKMPWEN
jgi:hypothetical protein